MLKFSKVTLAVLVSVGTLALIYKSTQDAKEVNEEDYSDFDVKKCKEKLESLKKAFKDARYSEIGESLRISKEQYKKGIDVITRRSAEMAIEAIESYCDRTYSKINKQAEKLIECIIEEIDKVSTLSDYDDLYNAYLEAERILGENEKAYEKAMNS